MRTPDDDSALRAAFSELQEQEQRGTPSFASVLAERPAERERLFGGLSLRLAVAVTAIVLVGATYRLVARATRLTVPREVVALAAWRPATDVLLETPGSTLLRGVPRLGASILGETSLSNNQITGVIR